MTIETARQRFIRNHDEDIRLMRISLQREIDAGNEFSAAQIRSIIAAWELIGDKAKSEEENAD